MAGWTSEQNAILKECSHLGFEACRDLIYQRYGVKRSIEATKRQAYRIGASTVRYEVCPECGRKVVRLNSETGLCKACNERFRAEEQRLLNVQIIKEIRSIENGSDYEYIVNKRRHDSIRQENSRLCRRHGLPGMRDRKRGDSVDLSLRLSNTRSSDQEVF